MTKKISLRQIILTGMIAMISFACSEDGDNGNDGPGPVSGNVIKSGQITSKDT